MEGSCVGSWMPRLHRQQGTPGMPESSFGPLRIWEGARPVAARGPAPPGLERPDDLASLQKLAGTLAAQEILRAPPSEAEPSEPLSLQWYLELEQIRHR